MTDCGISASCTLTVGNVNIGSRRQISQEMEGPLSTATVTASGPHRLTNGMIPSSTYSRSLQWIHNHPNFQGTLVIYTCLPVICNAVYHGFWTRRNFEVGCTIKIVLCIFANLLETTDPIQSSIFLTICSKLAVLDYCRRLIRQGFRAKLDSPELARVYHIPSYR